MTAPSETVAIAPTLPFEEQEGFDWQAQSTAGCGPADADDLLMACVVLGDRQAFRELIERNIDRVVALSRRLVGPHDADDIAQDVFLKIWTTRAYWDCGRASFRTWLYRVVVNRCIDYLRRPNHLDLDSVPEKEDLSPRADQILHDNEQARRVRKAVQALTDQQRIAITLYYHEGLNARECAEVLGIKLNAAESLLKRARGRLRELLSARVAE